MESLVYEQGQEKDWTGELLPIRLRIQGVLAALQGLTLLRGVLRDDTSAAVLQLLHALVSPQPDPAQIASSYSQAFELLAQRVNEETTPRLADAWQALLAMRLIEDRNPWSAQVERVGIAHVAPALRAQAVRDLCALQGLFALDGKLLLGLVEALVVPTLPALSAAWLPWQELAPQGIETYQALHARDALAVCLQASSDWTEMVEALESHWARHGTGAQAHYYALRWDSLERQFIGITQPDPIGLNSLIGQEHQQARLSKNLARFLAKLPAQDMLLYGPPGTGKSSTVKALVNAYADQGLRLIEVQKEDIGDLSTIVAQLRERAPHYLLFIDDLSFEDNEVAYKALKVVLEGTAQARPTNVIICATSNRLNLIRENFSDRGKPTEDVNWRDTMDEKQSLAHRFGLRVTFMSPDQRQYLGIVETLAHQRGLALPGEKLQALALQWERQHTGRSGRVARQFIDDLEAELKYR